MYKRQNKTVDRNHRPLHPGAQEVDNISFLDRPANIFTKIDASF